MADCDWALTKFDLEVWKIRKRIFQGIFLKIFPGIFHSVQSVFDKWHGHIGQWVDYVMV